MRVILFLAVLAFVAASFPAIGAEPKEIQYDGKPLRTWLASLKGPEEAQRKQAQSALLDIVRAQHDAVPAIIEAFLAASPTIEEKDFRVLQGFGPLLNEIGPPAAKALHPYLWDTDRANKIKALLGLALLNRHAAPALPGLLNLLENDKDEMTLRAALLVLRRFQDPAFLPVLLRMLDDPDAERWLNAAQVLVDGNYAPSKFLPVFRDWLNGEDELRRRAALLLLRSLERAAAPATDKLVDLLKRRDEEERLEAIKLLGRIGPGARAAVSILESHLNKADETIVFEAALALGRIAAHAAAKDALVGMTKNRDAAVRLKAVAALWQMNRWPTAPSVLKELLETTEGNNRLQAVRLAMLIGPGGPKLVPDLFKLLDDANPEIKLLAIRALGRIGPAAKPAVPALRALAKDHDEITRVFAATCLARIDPDATALERLVDLLKSENPDVRSKGLAELAALGPIAKPALPEIRKLLDDSDNLNRITALAALWQIDRDRDVFSEFRKRLRRPNRSAPDFAVLTFGDLFRGAAEPALPELVMQLWSEGGNGSDAADALGRIGPKAKKAVPALIRVLQAEHLDNPVYSASAEALGLIGPDAKAALPALTALLRHPDPLTRIHAALALLRIDRNDQGKAVIAEARLSRAHQPYITGLEAQWLLTHDRQVIDDLIRELRAAMMSDEEPTRNRRFMAARALGRIGSTARAALPDLKDLLFDEDPVLRRHVAEVIGQIEGKK